jgi:2,3-bisphosphoglycerate-independent phosphoglycerate mutase
MKAKKCMLIILDGWGLGTDPKVDALAQADTPNVDALMENNPSSTLVTFGEDVGLPEGQMGNSEVGHLNIGAGRVVYQDFARINKAIRERKLEQNPKLQHAIQQAKSKGKPFHLMGLLSDGGVHSHINHLKALINILEDAGLEEIYVHAFLDGRDTSPTGGKSYLQDLLKHLEGKRTKLATVIGRYYAMDRDTRWERTKLSYDLLVNAQGDFYSKDVLKVVQQNYEDGKTDEFMPAIQMIDDSDQAIGSMKDGDVTLFFNFRTDRPRQITNVLTQKDHLDQGMKKLDLSFYTMTTYDSSFEGVEVLFEKDNLANTLGEVVSAAGKTQVRIAETEKYPHVTFFLSGGREEPFEGESRILKASPKVATYDLAPEMSAVPLTDAIIEKIDIDQPDMIILNFANTDMIGHTGDFSAAMKAAEVVDKCVGRIQKMLTKHDYRSIIIADHGNSDFMINADGTPNTAHTTILVPCILTGSDVSEVKLKNGKLGDIAPTMLHLMGLEIPEEMDGNILL